MVSPKDKHARGCSTLVSSQASPSEKQANSINDSPSPAFKVQNDEQNYHWFRPDISGSRSLITATPNGNHHITAKNKIGDIVSQILNHVGSEFD